MEWIVRIRSTHCTPFTPWDEISAADLGQGILDCGRRRHVGRGRGCAEEGVWSRGPVVAERKFGLVEALEDTKSEYFLLPDDAPGGFCKQDRGRAGWGVPDDVRRGRLVYELGFA